MQRLTYLLLLCLLPTGVSWAADTLKFNTLRVGQHDDHTQVVVDLSGPVKYRYFTLSKPDRFVVDVLNVVGRGSKPALNLADTSIRNLRTGIRKGTDLRLVFELNHRAQGKVYLLKPVAGKPERLVVELAGGVTRHLAKAAPVRPKPAAKPRVKKELVASKQERDIIVAIDAGHGGVDPGAKGRRGTNEKEVTLAIARQLEALVKKEDGMRPLMIRNGDYFINLKERREKARRNKADIFISIHADSFPDPRAKGASVYALSQNGASSEAASLLANRENASDLVGGVKLDDKDDMLASVLLDLSQSATIENSIDVAGRVLKGLRHVSRIHKQRVQQAAFVVLKSPDIPSILVETAFISNPTEERNLRSHGYQHKLAVAMMSGIRAYFIANPPPGTRIAAREHIIRRGETLSQIASHYHVSLDTLRLTNQLKSDQLRIGQILQIPTSDS